MIWKALDFGFTSYVVKCYSFEIPLSIEKYCVYGNVTSLKNVIILKFFKIEFSILIKFNMNGFIANEINICVLKLRILEYRMKLTKGFLSFWAFLGRLVSYGRDTMFYGQGLTFLSK